MEEMSWTQVIIQIVVTLGAIFAGLFGLVKYFLKHLETKNGHLERVAKSFAETAEVTADRFHDSIIKQADAYREVAEGLSRSNINSEKTAEVICENTRMIGRNIEALEHISKSGA